MSASHVFHCESRGVSSVRRLGNVQGGDYFFLSIDQQVSSAPSQVTQTEGVSDMNNDTAGTFYDEKLRNGAPLADWLRFCHSENITVPEGIRRPSAVITSLTRINPLVLLRK